ncbi:MAG: hypothetical protein U9R25_04715 [Chloroflexota bacterium]|nr:hypothetical protein [Chloroflexota bacterium]
MVSELTREAYAFLNLLCGSLLLMALVAYGLFGRESRQLSVAILLGAVFLLCLLNSLILFLF